MPRLLFGCFATVKRRAARGALIAAAGGLVLAAAPPSPSSLLITGTRVLDTRSGRYMAAAAVLITGDRIVGVFAQPPAQVPADARHIDLPGTTLVPGLGDMYAWASPTERADADFYYAMALAHGVMTYRAVGVTLPWGASQRDRVKAGDVLAPRLFLSGPLLDPQAGTLRTRHVVDGPTARREIGELAGFGADWVSVSASTGADLYRTIVKVAKSLNLRVSGETGAASGLDLVRAGVDAIDRVPVMVKSQTDAQAADLPRDDPDALVDDLWSKLPAHDGTVSGLGLGGRPVFVVPLLASFRGTLHADALKDDPALARLPATWREDLLARALPTTWPGADRAEAAVAARGRQVRQLMASGLRVVTGVEVEGRGYTIPGAGVHRELALLVAAGLTPAEAIRAATLTCGEFVGASTTLGQIRAGFEADLIAVEGDPLRRVEDLQRIRLIVRGGEVLDRDQLLAQAKRATR